jgi:GGDEF domain-containing protein
VLNVSLTIGLISSKDKDSLEMVIKKSDHNLYAGKERGRNIVVY